MTTISPVPTTSNKRLFAILVLALAAWLAAYNLIQPLADWISYSALGLARSSRLGESLAFFLYDVPKILLLLSGMVFGISIVRTFFSPERTRALLGGKREGVGNVFAALLGIVTPFCSCSAVPLFIGFVESGIPLGVTFSFLIAAPTINEVAVILLLGLFGWDGTLQFGNWLTPLIAAPLTFGLLWLIPRVRILNPVRAHWVRTAESTWLDVFYQTIWELYRAIRRITSTFSSVLEGESGIMWTLLFLALFITIFSQGTP